MWGCWFLIIPTGSRSALFQQALSFSTVVSRIFRYIYPSNGIYIFIELRSKVEVIFVFLSFRSSLVVHGFGAWHQWDVA